MDALQWARTVRERLQRASHVDFNSGYLVDIPLAFQLQPKCAGYRALAYFCLCTSLLSSISSRLAAHGHSKKLSGDVLRVSEATSDLCGTTRYWA